MGNQEQLELLKQGVRVWNKWRQECPMIRPDLTGASLSQISLREADLSFANLSRADLHEVDLSKANLSDADLSDVNLQKADLHEANLITTHLHRADLRQANLRHASLIYANLNNANVSRADLSYANLSDTDLSYVNLSHANLSEVNLNNANLHQADFSKAEIYRTILIDLDLSVVKGLETVLHLGPSNIGIDTIYRSKGNIPEMFLRGTGVPDSFLEYMRSLVERPIDFYSCFISYSSQDQAFVERLHVDLQSKGVRCWFAPEDLKIGAHIQPSIDESIRLHDKLLLVLSQHSVTSQWVEQEVEAALAKERQERRTVLFPIRLDNTVMNMEGGWPALIRNTRNIGDFTRWKRHDAYQKTLDRLLRNFKAETAKEERQVP